MSYLFYLRWWLLPASQGGHPPDPTPRSFPGHFLVRILFVRSFVCPVHKTRYFIRCFWTSSVFWAFPYQYLTQESLSLLSVLAGFGNRCSSLVCSRVFWTLHHLHLRHVQSCPPSACLFSLLYLFCDPAGLVFNLNAAGLHSFLALCGLILYSLPP